MLRRIPRSKHKSRPAQRFLAAHPWRPEIPAIIRPHACLQRSLPLFDPRLQGSGRAARAGQRLRELRGAIFPRSGAHTPTLRTLWSYHLGEGESYPPGKPSGKGQLWSCTSFHREIVPALEELPETSVLELG